MAYAVHTGQFLQRGKGLGSLFSSLFRTLLPILKVGAKAGVKVGKRALQSKVVRSAAKELGKQALTSGVSVASDLIEGTKEGKENAALTVKKSRKRIADAMRQSQNPTSKKKRRIGLHRRKKIKKYSLFNT